MTRAIFLFISSILILSPLVFHSGDLSISAQLIYCTPFLLFLGIPHGALDNVLFISKKQVNNTQFIGIYLILVGANVALWLTIPIAAYLVFLLLSAYHFGQSQFTHYFNKQPISHKILFFSWGVSLLSGLVYLNISEIQLIISQFTDFQVFGVLHGETQMFYLFLISTLLTLGMMIAFVITKRMKMEALLMETLVMTLVFTCFYLMPLLIGFTLYFVILHSFKVLREEYEFLIADKEIRSITDFVKMVAPLTLLSIFGIVFLFALIYLNLLNLSYGYTLMIVISSITFPHVFVMNRFYNALFRRNFFKKIPA